MRRAPRALLVLLLLALLGARCGDESTGLPRYEAGSARLAPQPPAGGAASADDAWPREGQAFVPGEVIVLLRDPADEVGFIADARALGYTPLGVIPQLAAVQLGVEPGGEAAATVTLAADPRVAHAERHALARAQLVPDDAVYPRYQWNLRKIGMEAAWDATTGSPSVVVAVLDTGVDAGHPDLGTNVLGGYDFVNDDPNASDDASHGTYIAGVIAALGNNAEGIAGIAWRTRVLPVKVLDSQGLGPDAAVSRGIIFAVENRARIINVSSGTPYPSRLLEEAIRFAERRGVLVVAAAGNTGDRGNEVIYPAAYPSVLAVGAIDEDDDVPAFSQRHPYVAVAAPGVNIAGTAWRGAGTGLYITSSGTSAAAPHVSGLAALLLALKPEQTAVELRAAILQAADRITPELPDATAGAGRINAARSVSAVGSTARPILAPTETPAPAPGPLATLVPTRVPIRPGLAQPTPTPAVAATPGGLPSLRPLPQPGPLPAEPLSWFFADGNTSPPFETSLVLQNPLAIAASARIGYTTQDGLVAEETVMLGPNSRRTIRVNDVVPNALVSIRVDADTTVFAERSVYFGNDAIGGIGTRSPSRTWFLAEGSTQPPFDTWIVLQNPQPLPANVRLRLMPESGEIIEVNQPLAPLARVGLHMNDVLPSIGFATFVSSDLPIVVERSMYFANGTGGHGSVGVKTPGKTWFLAEGDTRAGSDTWILLQNPGSEVANVALTLMTEDGTTTPAYYALDPSTRLSLFADTVAPNTTFGARIDADQPIVVERSVYLFGGAGGHNAAAVPIPDTEWYVPGGSTRGSNREVLALLNPNAEATQVDVTFAGGESQLPVTRSVLMRPTSRMTFDVNQFMPDSDVSARIVADKPVVVERTIYHGSGATSSPGLTR